MRAPTTSWLHLGLAELRSLIFLKLVVAGHLTLFVARTREPFFARPRPAPVLLGAVLATQALAAAIVGFGWFVARLPWGYVGLVWAYCLAWLPIEDGAKRAAYQHMGLAGKRHREHLEVAERPLGARDRAAAELQAWQGASSRASARCARSDGRPAMQATHAAREGAEP